MFTQLLRVLTSYDLKTPEMSDFMRVEISSGDLLVDNYVPENGLFFMSFTVGHPFHKNHL